MISMVVMENQTCTLTERGQVSLPASLRRKMHLKTGQKLRWERVSDIEFRVVVEPDIKADPLKALGFGAKFQKETQRTTEEWMNEIRASE